ncbi:PAS domain-containing sensor histidine kinase [Ktedonobacter racemifer]|uniref:histidine kinase n=1 Tax=Ktedonobacter racemifer DSM 44963 TaxID=485913 RepID=D6TTS8_KTERA|nr:PAS domain-containing sensor histidine kinase [Ktedonobacter racemifer]EFH83829.1 PAS/PAC sensor signal transduction histidine kinase [Ktedonobacter racemifer DSM 44963]
MSNAKQSKRLTLASSGTLLTMLETLPGAFFFIDDAATIVYANASAQAMLGAPLEALRGNNFWRCAPYLVSTTLYQAVRKTKQARALTEVEYVSPVTQALLHVHLAPTVGGLTLQFHEVREPIWRQEIFPQGERLCIDDLDGLHTRIGILTPEGIVLDINAVPLDDAQVRREEVIGKPLAEAPWWSSSPGSQEQLRAAIARASTGETAHFEAQLCPREGIVLSSESVITPHLDADHQVEYLVIAGIDITARKRAEREIHALIDAIPQLVWTGRPDGYVDSYNQRWRDYTGLSTEQAQGNGWMQCTHPADRQRVLEVWQNAVQTGRPYETEQRLRQHTTGEYRWFLMQAVPFKDAQGTILKYIGTCTDIDEQKRAQQQLKTSEENWRGLAETVPQLVWTTSPDGRVEYWNQRWYTYTGSSLEHALGHEWSQFLPPDEYQHTLTVWHHALETGEPYEIEYRLKEGQTGGYRWFLVRAMPVRDDTRQIVKWFGTCTDIDDRKQAEQQLKESREHLRVLAETVPQLVWSTGPDGLTEDWNQRFADYFQATPEQLRGYGWRQFLHPEEYDHVRAVRDRSLETGEPYEIEYRLREGKTGLYRWFLARALPVRDEAGQILKWFGTATDIDEQKQVEQQLKISEQNWRVLAETVPQLVWTVRPDGQHEYTNQRWHDYTGSTLEHMQSDQWAHLQFIHPDDREDTRALWQHALDTGAMYDHEERLRESQTGLYRWFLVRGMPVRDDTGQIVKWFGTCTDIEDQKCIEEALRQSQERIRALIDSNIIGIVSVEGEENVLVEANEAYLHMTGYTQEDVRSRTLSAESTTPPEQAPLFQRALQEITARGQHTPLETELVCKDGSRLPVLVGGVIFQERPRLMVSFVLDNSARKELEQRKDAFISMASHELRNPLAALKMQTQLVQKRLERQSLHEAATALSRVEGPVKQLERLIGELLDVSKIQAGRLEYRQETVDLDALLHEVADTMQQLSTTHTIVVRGAAPHLLVGDKDRLGQVFTNLISNAIKYSPDTEAVEIDLSASEETVTISVHDHGLGIPREQRDKIFERFYRATGPRQRAIPGLGMGLYIVAEIVKRHEGTITVDSTVGKGSTFTVTLPCKRDT